jgi:hypothetical protein
MIGEGEIGREIRMEGQGDTEIGGIGIRKTGIPGDQDIRDRKRKMIEAKRDFNISLLIFTMACVGGTSLGQTFTH